MTQESEIQLLVDGELDAAKRSRLLSGAEQSPELWKSIAMAFVENQIWQESLADIDQLVVKPAPVPMTVLNKNESKSSESMERSANSRWLWLAALASCLFLGLMIGDRINRRPDVPDFNNADLGQLEKPVLETQEIDKSQVLARAIERSDIPIPVGFRHQLLRAGYQVEERQTFELVSLPIGGTIEIPTRNVEIKFVGLAAFQ